MSVIKELIQRGDKLHGNRGSLLSLWQETADHFYPERADFTVTRHLGDEFADGLMSSYPLIVRRELGNAFSAMLRPRTKVWAHMTVEDEDRLGKPAKMWLEEKTKVQRRVMYDRQSQFIRATREGDHDFASFGQTVIQREIDWSRPGLLYRTWHLRDVAWAENVNGQVDEIHRNWKPTVRDLMRKFKGTVHPNISKYAEKDGFKEIPCRAIVLPTDEFGGDRKYRQPWVQLYIDIENKHIMEEVPLQFHGYTIPRWQTVSGSQYAYSPAVVAGLPDARLIQAITLTLLEAGEMAVRPAMIATQDAIRSDVQLYPGGITWADVEYDARKADVLRPINRDLSGMPFGLEQQADIREMLATAFYLNKITLPIRGKDMTAYEASKLYEQYIRDAIPLFEPMETDYNGALCEDTFDVLLRIGVFGSLDDVPQDLRGRDIQFRFESPLHDAIEQEKGEKLQIGLSLAAQTMEIDQSTPMVIDAVTALRESLAGIGFDAKWIRDEREFAKLVGQQQEAAAAEKALALAQQGADLQATVNA